MHKYYEYSPDIDYTLKVYSYNAQYYAVDIFYLESYVNWYLSEIKIKEMDISAVLRDVKVAKNAVNKIHYHCIENNDYNIFQEV